MLCYSAYCYAPLPTISSWSTHLRRNFLSVPRSLSDCCSFRLCSHLSYLVFVSIRLPYPQGACDGASTPCAFEWSCVHTSFTLALLWDKPTPRPSFKPHPPTTDLGLQVGTRFSPILLFALTQAGGIVWKASDLKSPIQGEPEHLQTNLFLINPPSEVGWHRALT